MSLASLTPSELRLRVDPAALGFADTRELVDLPLPWIGQDRAEQAARFGLQMVAPDYNLFVLGDVGTGRSSLMNRMMRDQALQRPAPPDLCYLHNFEQPEHPRALRLPPGEGRLLRQLMADFARLLQVELPKRLLATEAVAERERIETLARAEEDLAYAELTAYAGARGFGLDREDGRMVFVQRDAAGQPLTAEAAQSLAPEQRQALEVGEAALRAEISRFLERSHARELAVNEQLVALRRQRIRPLLEQALQTIRNGLRKQIKDWVKLGRHLDQVRDAVLDNLALFQTAGEDDDLRMAALATLMARLGVNVVVDHHGETGAPVITEDNPLFRNLFGSIEYASENDVLVTDFSRVRAGSLLKAHGGFLLLHLRDLLADPQVWEKLRRFLRSGRLQIEEPGMVFAPIAAVSLQPEPLDVDVKIVLVASVEDYYQVQENDPEFTRHFRCKVDFAERFAATPETHHATAVFVAQACRRLGLVPFSAAAVAQVIEQTHRDAEDQSRQSACFGAAEALVVEASAHARSRGASQVEAEDVHAALQARRHRNDYPEQRLQQAIVDGDRLIEVSGYKMAQVNGLSVVDLGDYEFGIPVRVTASAHAGEEGLLNIEREVELSGPIHDKGVLILQGHLTSLFAHIAPMALNASVVFEQEYNGVEGDSASCAELFALLSALSGLPLNQAIAVTGALNQHGEMLPVGGINDKIEGFFRTCELLGLDGQQGVLIPRRNRRNLMLSPRVVQAVAEGRFHVHVADTVADGMALLTGHPYGESQANGYPVDSVLGRAQATLLEYRRACESLEWRRSSHAQRMQARQLGDSRRR